MLSELLPTVGVQDRDRSPASNGQYYHRRYFEALTAPHPATCLAIHPRGRTGRSSGDTPRLLGSTGEIRIFRCAACAKVALAGSCDSSNAMIVRWNACFVPNLWSMPERIQQTYHLRNFSLTRKIFTNRHNYCYYRILRVNKAALPQAATRPLICHSIWK